MQRCFIAYMLTDSEAKQLNTALATIKKYATDKARWIPKKNYHITLKFLGNIDQKKINGWEKKLRKMSKNQRCIATSLKKTALFKSHKKKILVFLCDPNQEIINLISCLEKEASIFSDKPSKPHVTLAYIKQNSSLCSQLLPPVAPPVNLKINHIALMASKPDHSGANYQEIASFSLQY